MKKHRMSSLLFCLAAITFWPALAGNLAGTWGLEVRDLKMQAKVIAKVRFSQTAASSCMAGTWKVLVIDSASKRTDEFFPIGTPLAYTTRDGKLTLGRTEVCDGYLLLSGAEHPQTVSGSYASLSIGGGQQLGTFTLRRLSE